MFEDLCIFFGLTFVQHFSFHYSICFIVNKYLSSKTSNDRKFKTLSTSHDCNEFCLKTILIFLTLEKYNQYKYIIKLQI